MVDGVGAMLLVLSSSRSSQAEAGQACAVRECPVCVAALLWRQNCNMLDRPAAGRQDWVRALLWLELDGFASCICAVAGVSCQSYIS